MDAIVTLKLFEFFNPLCYLRCEHNCIDKKRFVEFLPDVYLQLKTTLSTPKTPSPDLRRRHLDLSLDPRSLTNPDTYDLFCLLFWDFNDTPKNLTCSWRYRSSGAKGIVQIDLTIRALLLGTLVVYIFQGRNYHDRTHVIWFNIPDKK